LFSFLAIEYTANSKVSFNHNSISEDKEIVKNSTPVKKITNTANGINKYTQKLEETEFSNGATEEETEDITHLNGNSLTQEHDPGTLIIEDAVASWVIGAEPTINKLTFRVEPGSLVAVIGAVGSGKSSLIQTLLGELPLTSGKAMVVARAVSYSSQEPWIFSGSLRENILFGKPFERRRYNQVSYNFLV
jgi:ABC-type multidrug transport system fused ATPase/permease subunit